MLKKTFLVTLFLFSAYSIFVTFVKPDWKAAQFQSQGNKLRVENYIYNNDAYAENLIVGSSLSARIITSELENTYNLSCGGLASIDALIVLAQKKRLPKNIFIEINSALLSMNTQFTSRITSWSNYFIWKYLHALRVEKQPIGFLGAFILKALKFIEDNRRIGLKADDSKANYVNTSVFRNLVDLQKKIYSKNPDNAFIHECFKNLHKHVVYFEKKGVQIYFFEMPTNQELCNLPWPQKIRDTFPLYFPQGRYKYIPMPDCAEYRTTDGLHIFGDEALRYTAYLKMHMKHEP